MPSGLRGGITPHKPPRQQQRARAAKHERGDRWLLPSRAMRRVRKLMIATLCWAYIAKLTALMQRRSGYIFVDNQCTHHACASCSVEMRLDAQRVSIKCTRSYKIWKMVTRCGTLGTELTFAKAVTRTAFSRLREFGCIGRVAWTASIDTCECMPLSSQPPQYCSLHG